MNSPEFERVGCAKSAREVRDRLSAEIEDMSHEELVSWLRSHQYSDPVLARLAEKAAQRGRPA